VNKSLFTFLFAAILVLALSGCASSMNGTGGSDKLSCKAPDGVACSSLDGVYANALANNLPGLQKKGSHQKGSHSADDKSIPDPDKTSYNGINQTTPGLGDAIFTPQHIVRLWMAPWEDDEGNLHDQQYIYMIARQGRWIIEHNEQPILDKYRPTFLKTPASQAAQPEDGAKKQARVMNNQMSNPKIQTDNPNQGIPQGLGPN
jgi:conjugal transfer pilus assembly protein TraV